MNEDTTQTLRDAIGEILDGAPQISSTPAISAVQKRAQHRRWPALVAAASFIAVAAVGAFALASADRSPTRPTEADSPSSPLEGGTAAESTTASPSSAEPSSSAAVANLPTTTTVIIPTPDGQQDHRSPILRFLGVPADPADAATLDRLLSGQATADCMDQRGQPYEVSLDETPGNPNTAYGTSLTGDEQAQFREALSTCEQAASDRTHLTSTDLGDEYAELEISIASDSRMLDATEAFEECVAQQGVPPYPTEGVLTGGERTQEDSDEEARAVCRVTFDPTAAAIREEYETQWILDNSTPLTQFRAELNDLRARAGA